jgi:ABC-type microcin C transport system permease subunit YejE
MNLWRIFELNPSTVVTAKRCLNLVATAVIYTATILVLALVGFGLVRGLGAIGELVGLDPRTSGFIGVTGTVAYAVLVMASVLLMIGDAIKLVVLYVSSWGQNDGEDQNDHSDEQE